MQSRHGKAIAVALALSLSAPMGMAQTREAPGMDRLTAETHIGRPPGNVMFPDDSIVWIPGDSWIPGDLFFPEGAAGPFAPEIVRNFESQRITTIGDLITADPQLVGRILEIDPRQAQAIQRDLRESLSRR